MFFIYILYILQKDCAHFSANARKMLQLTKMDQ